MNNLRIRPIRSDDWHRLQLFHRRLSQSSIQLRFHGAIRELSTPLAHRFTDLDGHDNVAFVATTGTRGRIIGVGRFFRLDAKSAEVAFVVEDAYQGQGIGRHLMQHLVTEARKNGIDEFVAEVLPENTIMLRLLAETGPIRMRTGGEVCEVRLDLTALPANQGLRNRLVREKAPNPPSLARDLTVAGETSAPHQPSRYEVLTGALRYDRFI